MKKFFLLIIGTLSVLAIMIALISQHYFEMQPCPWCILERMILILLAIFSFGAHFYKKIILIPVVITITGLLISIYHVLVASKSNSCNISMAEKIINYTNLNKGIPDLFGITGMCADNYSILGINYPIYFLILIVLISILLGKNLINKN